MNTRILLPLLLGVLLTSALCIALCRVCWGRRAIPYETPDFRDRAGFRIIRLPDRPTIHYGKIRLLDRQVGEVECCIEPGYQGLLRVTAGGGDLFLEDLSIRYDARTVIQQDGIRVLLQQTPAGPALATWSRSGFDYALYFSRSEMGLAGALSAAFAQETLAVFG